MLVNTTRFDRALARSGCAALIATTPQNVGYVAGYHSERLFNFVAFQAYALTPPDPQRWTLVLPSTELSHLASAKPAVARVRRYGRFSVMAETAAALTAEERRLLDLFEAVPAFPSPVEALAAAIEETGLARERIGLDENNLPWPLLDALRQRLPHARFEPAAHLFHWIRMVKTPAELAILRRACAINEAALEAAIAAIRPGASEDEPYRAFRTATAAAGAVPRLWGTSSGANSSCFFWPGTRALERGDLVRIDCGGTLDGYWSDTGVTVACGAVRDDHRRVYDILAEAIDAGAEAARPGAPVTAVCTRVMEVARRRGLADLERHHCGHGIGRELYEPPMLVGAGAASDIFAGGGDDLVLEPDMVINVEAPYYRLGFGGLHLEHTLRITQQGAERLTGDRRLRIAPWD